MSIQIQNAKPSDAEAISRIGRQSFTDAFGSLFVKQNDLQDYLDYTYAVSKIAGSINKSNNAFFLARENGEPVGFAKAKKHSLNEQIKSFAQMELQKIYVLKDHHGSGAGARLLESVLSLAEQLRPDHVWLDVHIGNHRAIRFYEKNGFGITGKHFFTIGSQQFEYHLMSLTLNPNF